MSGSHLPSDYNSRTLVSPCECVRVPELQDLESSIAPTDRSLVAAVRDGDARAAEELYERYARRLVGLVRSKMGAKLRAAMEPEDIVQSVFMSIFRGVREGSFDAPPGNTLWNLLAVIAVNKTRRRARFNRAEKRNDDRNLAWEESSEVDDRFQLNAAEVKLSLEETLEHLRPVDREILLHRMNGESVDDISKSIGRTGRTVERSLKRSREKLADLLL